MVVAVAPLNCSPESLIPKLLVKWGLETLQDGTSPLTMTPNPSPPDSPHKSGSLLHWEDQPDLAWLLSILWLAFLCFVAFWWRLGSTGLVDETEPLFAEASRQMNVTGNWVTPFFNGVTRFDKPPLVYWMMAIAFKLFGVNEWTVRCPSAIAATVLTAIGFYALKFSVSQGHLKSPRAPWLAAWIGSALMALNLQTIAWARIGVSDMLLSGCMGAALFSFFLGYAQSDRASKAQSRWYLAFYIFSALAVLTKGPVGIVLPVLIIGCFLLYMGNFWAVLKETKPLRGILLFLVITVPWYVLVILANGENYINAFFGYHNLERFSQVVNNHHAPWWFFFAVVPLSFIPWSVYLPVAIARLQFWRIHHWRTQPRAQQLGMFALIWFAVIFGFFTIAATKLPSYTLPLLPAAAVLVALFWTEAWTEAMFQSKPSRGAWISHWFSIGLAAVLAIASHLSLQWLDGDQDMPLLQEWVEQIGLTHLATGVWMSVAIASLVLLIARRDRWLWLIQLVGFVAFLLTTLMPFAALVDAQRQYPLRRLAQTIKQVRQPGERLIMAGYNKPSLVFYTQSPLTFITQHDQVLPTIQRLKRNRRRQSVLLVVRQRKLSDTRLKPGQYQLISQSGVFQLIRVPLK